MKFQRGQGLLESIVAIGVVITGLIGAISLINFSLRSTDITENRMIALNLSWEGIEVVVNLRDTNYLEDQPYNTVIDQGTTAILEFDEASNTWFFDFAPSDFSDNGTRFYRENGLYVQATQTPAGVATPFKRLVYLNHSVPGQVLVRSVVQWEERGNVKDVESTRILYDWR